jgi:phosphoribosylaminoimidazole-succinocarboxamide synthase
MLRAMPLLSDLPLIASGKVRELYDLGDDKLLLVATDRISTYDAIHPTPIPGKGSVLTGLSVFWFGLTEDVVPNHFISDSEGVPDEVKGRAIVVKKLKIIPLEAIVRGYITGSGWKDYLATGKVSGHVLPEGLKESEQLPAPLFTPSTKADIGDHDETVDLEQAAKIVGDDDLLAKVQDLSIKLYEKAAEHARERGLILADTKFEFGIDSDGVLRVADEVLTPDSSRYWPVEGYEAGKGQPSFDKQFVRDWATQSGWDKQDPAPAIPAEIVEGTSDRYRDAYLRITGEPLTDWLERIGASAA